VSSVPTCKIMLHSQAAGSGATAGPYPAGALQRVSGADPQRVESSTINPHFIPKMETPAGIGPAGISPGGKRMKRILLLLPLIVVTFDIKVKVIIKKR
jgi:hypothetical protein